MSCIQLTDRFILNATSKGAIRVDYVDTACKGLALRVTDKGNKTWTFKYTSPRDGKSARITLGTYPATGLKDARTKAVEARGNVERRVDPRDIVAAPKAVEKTMAELIEDRLRMEVRAMLDPKTGAVMRPALRSAEEMELRFKRNVLPVVGNVPVREFRISHLNKVLDPITARGALRMVGMVYTDLNTVLKFGVGRGEIEYNPIANARVDLGTNVRQNTLKLEEIAIVWDALPAVFAKSVNVQRIVKLLLATGQRLTEVAGMKRGEVNLRTRVWVIPATRVKNGYEHAVPLSDLAVSIIQEAMRATNGDFLFPNRKGDDHLPGEMIGTTVLRAQMPTKDREESKFGSIPRWRPHDLRRTVGTQMLSKGNGLAISRFDKALVLNHRSATKGNVSDQVYDTNEYLDEKREALEKWGAFLARLVGEDQQMQDAAE